MRGKSFDEMVLIGAQAMRNSPCWPAVFGAGAAETLAGVCLSAALAPPLPADEYDATLDRVAAAMQKP